MELETTGIVVSAARQWWLKVNTKIIRKGTMDGATFPYIIKVRYQVDGREYFCRKWIGAGKPVPEVGSSLTVVYAAEKAAKGKILL